MNIVEYSDYKRYIRDLVKSKPRRGRGLYLRLARLLEVKSSMITYIFKGKSQLSADQALLVAEEFELSPLERDYFLDMVHLARAVTPKTREFYQDKLAAHRKRFLNLSERVSFKAVLEEKDQAVFYSHWYYIAVQILTAIPGYDQPRVIAEQLGMSQKRVTEVLDFLARTGLCTFDGSKYGHGSTKTYLNRDSVLVDRHHANWRMRAMHNHPVLTHEELAYTCPAALSKADFVKVREEIAGLIEKFNKIVDPSPMEEIACLNIDWFRIR